MTPPLDTSVPSNRRRSSSRSASSKRRAKPASRSGYPLPDDHLANSADSSALGGPARCSHDTLRVTLSTSTYWASIEIKCRSGSGFALDPLPNILGFVGEVGGLVSETTDTSK